MQDSIKLFFSELHKNHLKSRGYTKERHTFSRDMGKYTEKIQFQGCSWNDSKGPWGFYVNYGIQFHDLPPAVPVDFSRTHCSARLDSLIGNSPKHFHIRENNSNELAQEISDCVDNLSKFIAERFDFIRESYPVKKLLTLRVLK